MCEAADVTLGSYFWAWPAPFHGELSEHQDRYNCSSDLLLGFHHSYAYLLFLSEEMQSDKIRRCVPAGA